MYNVKGKLTKQQQTDLFIELAKAIGQLRNTTEVAHLLQDLLTEAEVFMLARRLQIAHLLIEGSTFEATRAKLKVGFGTIAKVQGWLQLHGDGYRTIIQRMKKHPSKGQKQAFGQTKKKYPMYFWPELLLDEIIKSANRREKARLAQIASNLKDKSKLSREIINLLNP